MEILKSHTAKEAQAAMEAHTILEREVQDMRREVRELMVSHAAEVELLMVRHSAMDAFYSYKAQHFCYNLFSSLMFSPVHFYILLYYIY